ncbi:MAG: thioredoxin domain-containing protein [Patulibacter sp.]
MTVNDDQKQQARAKREDAQAAAATAAKRNRNLQVLAGLVFAAIVVVVLVVIVGGAGNEKSGTGGAAKGDAVQGVAATKELLAGVEQNGLVLGDPKAPITMLEFLDVQCPYCRQHQLDHQPEVIKNLVRTGRIQLKVQPIALPQMGEDSEAGRAVALRLSHVNHTWDFLNLFYWNQGDEGTGYVTPTYLQALLKAIPGAPDDVTRTLDERDQRLASDIDDASKVIAEKYASAGERFGTPAFAIAKSGSGINAFAPVFIRSADAAADLESAVDKLERKLNTSK